MKILVVADNPGRLGNLINRHGHLLAFAIENKCALVDYSFLDFSVKFPRLNGNLLQGTPNIRVGVTPSWVLKIGFRIFRLLCRFGRPIRQLTKGAVEFVDTQYPVVTELETSEFLERIKSARIVILTGYLFEARDLFVKHAEAIRRQFDFSASTRKEGRSYLAALRESGAEIVGVHIRHTDYRDYVGGRWFYTAAQYAQVMRWVAGQHPDRRFRFVVCSDEAQSSEAFSGLDVYLHSSDYWGDLHVLTLCDRLISTSSSFSRAAAFLGNIPLLRIFDPDLPTSHHFVKVDVLEEGWHWEGEMARTFGRARPGTTPPADPCVSE